MGVSTDGLLFWGICFGEDEHPEWFDEDDDERIAAIEGVPQPEVEFSEETTPIFHEYWDKKRECLARIGVTVGTHCSYDFPMYYVCITDSLTRARRGYPEEVGALESSQNWRDKLKAFCEKHEVPWAEPKWWLASLWG